MQRKVIVFLSISLVSAGLIGSLITEMLPFRSDVVMENQADQLNDMTESAIVEEGVPLSNVDVDSDQQTADIQEEGQLRTPVTDGRRVRKRIHVRHLTGESETVLLDKLKAHSQKEPAYVADWIDQTLSRVSQGLIEDTLVYPLLYLWVEIEPDVALARLGEFSSESEIPYLMLSHAQRLADETTPAEALEWAGSLEDHSSSKIVVDGLLQQWLEHDPANLATHVELVSTQSPVGIDGAGNTVLGDHQAAYVTTDQFRKRVATALIEQDPARALQWADSLSAMAAEEVRTKAFDSWLEHEPVAATDWLYSQLRDVSSLPASLASALAGLDIDSAITVLPSLPAASQSAMTSTIVQTLSKADPNEARAWADGLTDPQQRSDAAAAWALGNAKKQPTEALNTVLQATSGQRRVDTLMDVAIRVGQVDQALLENWLSYAPLSNYERSTIASVVLGSDAYPFQ